MKDEQTTKNRETGWRHIGDIAAQLREKVTAAYSASAQISGDVDRKDDSDVAGRRG